MVSIEEVHFDLLRRLEQNPNRTLLSGKEQQLVALVRMMEGGR